MSGYSDAIKQHLLSGCHLIVDRYSYSGVAFSSSKGLDLQWCFQPEKGLPGIKFRSRSVQDQQTL